jgi:hypothetical protein
MGWILVPVVVQQKFCGPALMTIIFVKEPVIDTVMGMGTMTMHYFTKDSLPDHIENGKVVSAETPVFQHHAWNASFF